MNEQKMKKIKMRTLSSASFLALLASSILPIYSRDISAAPSIDLTNAVAEKVLEKANDHTGLGLYADSFIPLAYSRIKNTYQNKEIRLDYLAENEFSPYFVTLNISTKNNTALALKTGSLKTALQYIDNEFFKIRKNIEVTELAQDLVNQINFLNANVPNVIISENDPKLPVIKGQIFSIQGSRVSNNPSEFFFTVSSQLQCGTENDNHYYIATQRFHAVVPDLKLLNQIIYEQFFAKAISDSELLYDLSNTQIAPNEFAYDLAPQQAVTTNQVKIDTEDHQKTF